MASTILHSRGARTRTPVAQPVGPRVYERPVGAAFTGLAALIVGAWGALAGYIGPYFDFRPVDANVWVGSWENGVLHLLPGAVAAAAGLMLMAMGPARRSVRGGAFLLPALLLLAAGAWFVIGPVAWPTFHSGAAFEPTATATRNLLNVACASYAPGLVLVMLGGMALKAGMVPGVMVEDPYTPASAAPVATTEAAPVVAGEGAVADRPVAGRPVAEAERPVADRPITERPLGAGAPTTATPVSAERSPAGTDSTSSVTAADATASQPVAAEPDMGGAAAERRGLWRRGRTT